MMPALSRRDVATRRTPWARQLAAMLHQAGIRPNAVSVAGLAFALLALAAFLSVHVTPSLRAVLSIAAAAAIQLRLLCNMLDGMLAVEGGLKSKTGDLFNEVPDRLADVAILVGAGYSLIDVPGGPALGWAAAAAALLTAYVRVLGGSLGLTQDFGGPMAKPQRMFVLTVATLLNTVEIASGRSPMALPAGLVVITAGAIVTACRRVVRLAAQLEAR